MKQLHAYVCKSEEKLLERLDQPILDVIDNPEKTQQTEHIYDNRYRPAVFSADGGADR